MSVAESGPDASGASAGLAPLAPVGAAAVRRSHFALAGTDTLRVAVFLFQALTRPGVVHAAALSATGGVVPRPPRRPGVPRSRQSDAERTRLFGASGPACVRAAAAATADDGFSDLSQCIVTRPVPCSGRAS